jgi:hypothetical protein
MILQLQPLLESSDRRSFSAAVAVEGRVADEANRSLFSMQVEACKPVHSS